MKKTSDRINDVSTHCIKRTSRKKQFTHPGQIPQKENGVTWDLWADVSEKMI